MKRIIFLLQLCGVSICCMAQPSETIAVSQSAISSQSLDITHTKTTSLIFPAAIKSVDRGSVQVLVQKPQGIENVLKVKAADRQLEETNLTVITADGRLYSFNVHYTAKPANMTIQVSQLPASTFYTPVQKVSQVQFSNVKDNTETLKAMVAQASVTKRNIRKVKSENNKVKAAISGLYTANDLFFYKLVLDNQTPVNYEIESVRYFIRDTKEVKRTAKQEVELEPNYIVGTVQPVKAGEERVAMIVLPKHGIGKDKELAIVVTEKDGGRTLTCVMNNKTLLKAKPFRLD